MREYDLSKCVCVVTGAAGGIGLGIAQALVQEGAKVAMIDILEDKVCQQAQLLSASGGIAKGYAVDITDRDAVFETFAKIRADLGPIDTLVNNAGVVDQRPFEEITGEQIDHMMKVNVNGTLFCCQAVAPDMKKAKAGHIINFSSKSGKTGSASMAHYSAAKGAIIALTHSLAFELAPDNVTVNCICPGITEATGVWSHVSEAYTKNMNLEIDKVRETFAAKVPLQRLTRIQDVVNFVLFLATRADYCTGQAFNITGGREVH
ncbi:MAG: SDR family oxidoreductase [Phycisphaeraceae bacterium]|nr:SDR family oxidoreductase [Phycisphaeraceae bacterium]